MRGIKIFILIFASLFLFIGAGSGIDFRDNSYNNIGSNTKNFTININSSSDNASGQTSRSIFQLNEGGHTYDLNSIESISYSTSYDVKWDEDGGFWNKHKTATDYSTLVSHGTLNNSNNYKTSFYPNGNGEYIKTANVSISLLENGYLKVSETNKHTDYENTDKIYTKHNEESQWKNKVMATIIKSEYKFTVKYKNIYDLGLDNFNENIIKTNLNLIPDNKMFFTSEYTYEDLESILRKYLVTSDLEYEISPETPLAESVGIKFYYDSAGEKPVESKTSSLTSDDIFVKFVSNGSNVYNETKILNYQIPYVHGVNVTLPTDEEHQYTSFGNKSNFLFKGNLKSKIKVYLNTGGTINIREDFEGVENLEKVEIAYKDSAYKEISIDEGYYRIPIENLGEYKIKLTFEKKIYAKNETSDGEDDQIIIDINNADGQTYFNNNDFFTETNNSIEHNYGIYNEELFEYYQSEDIFKFNKDNVSNYLFSENFIYGDSNYKGKLYKVVEGEEGLQCIDIDESEILTSEGSIVSIGDENKAVYVYELKDVFGNKYNYVLETNYDEKSIYSDQGLENYFDTSVGNELYEYLVFTYPEITTIDDIQNSLSYKDINKFQSELIGKRNLNMYLPNEEYINSIVGKIEYGTMLSEKIDIYQDALMQDITRQGFDKESFIIELDDLEDIALTDTTHIKVNLKGVIGSTTYGHNEIEIIPDIIKNLSYIKLDSSALSDITSTFTESSRFSAEIMPSLNGEIFNQLLEPDNYYLGINQDVDYNLNGIPDFSINWRIPSIDNNEIGYNHKVEYKISSENTDDYINNYEGEFRSKTYVPLNKMYISNFLIQNETFGFKTETKFVEMEQALNSAINFQLKLKLYNPNRFSIEWKVNGEEINEDTIVKNGDILDYTIWPEEDAYRFHEFCSGNFESKQYLSISDIVIDTKELDEYLNSRYVGIKLYYVKPELERMINEQISEQIGSIDSKNVEIIWFDGDDEALNYGSKLEFKLESKNGIEIHNSENKYEIQYHKEEFKNKFGWIEILLLIIIIIITFAILLIIYKLFLA